MSGVHRDECRVRLLYGRGARPYEDGCMMAYMIIAGLIGFVIDKGMLLVESILLKWKVD